MGIIVDIETPTLDKRFAHPVEIAALDIKNF